MSRDSVNGKVDSNTHLATLFCITRRQNAELLRGPRAKRVEMDRAYSIC